MGSMCFSVYAPYVLMLVSLQGAGKYFLSDFQWLLGIVWYAFSAVLCSFCQNIWLMVLRDLSFLWVQGAFLLFTCSFAFGCCGWLRSIFILSHSSFCRGAGTEADCIPYGKGEALDKSSSTHLETSLVKGKRWNSPWRAWRPNRNIIFPVLEEKPHARV